IFFKKKKFDKAHEAITEIWSMDELQDTAVDALVTVLEMYFEKNRVFLEPSKPKKNEVMVALPLIVVAKMLLLNVMVSSNIRPCDLARKMHIKPQEVNRIIDLQHKTKLDTIDSAMRALGKSLQLTVV
ncbi:MAG: hypothetical protein SPG96_08895, partial [Succinivibrio sp.]|nr:hypothetical protein [Succinivibrio sp.]